MNEYREYLVPANTKKSLLIFNILRPLDAIILAFGVSITVGALIFIGADNTLLLMVGCLPMLISVILVLPIPNYHNTLVGIQSILNFYNGRRNYIWKGWCSYNEFKDSK